MFAPHATLIGWLNFPPLNLCSRLLLICHSSARQHPPYLPTPRRGDDRPICTHIDHPLVGWARSFLFSSSSSPPRPESSSRSFSTPPSLVPRPRPSSLPSLLPPNSARHEHIARLSVIPLLLTVGIFVALVALDALDPNQTQITNRKSHRRHRHPHSFIAKIDLRYHLHYSPRPLPKSIR